MNRISTIKNFYISLPAAFLFFSFLFSWAVLADTTPTYRIIIDPGHGGAISKRKDDKWDPVENKYQDFYSYGMQANSYHEHKVVLELAKRVHYYVNLTATDEGWIEFEKILGELSSQKNFKRIHLDALLTREDGWDDRSSNPEEEGLNDPYRLYDFPDKNKKKQMGRISFINSKKPYLVVSLHLNPAGRGHPGGMAAVLSPGFKTFDTVRKIHLGKLPYSRFKKLKWWKDWLITEPGWSKYQSARSDTWVYFHGYRTLKSGNSPWLQKNRGFRYNMVTWNYSDEPGWEKTASQRGPGQYAFKYSEFKPSGTFWEREQAKPEKWRREGGSLGYGGDNHFASDELLRFIQYGVRQLNPQKRSNSSIGPMQPPYVSTYSLPTFTNAICAYLEVGYLNRKRDRDLVMETREETAKSIAVGIYSLFMGIKLKKHYGRYYPKGKKLNFSKYEKYEKGNYFKIVSD